MAALTAAVEIQFDGNHPPTIIQMKSSGTLTFFRGSLLHGIAGTGTILKAPAATDHYAGIAWEGKATVANDLIFLAITGRFFFVGGGATMTDANWNKCFAMLAATLTDNPADFGVSVAGTAGAIGTLDQVVSTGVSGWLNTDRRITAENL
jgi:hypothetical protein